MKGETKDEWKGKAVDGKRGGKRRLKTVKREARDGKVKIKKKRVKENMVRNAK